MSKAKPAKRRRLLSPAALDRAVASVESVARREGVRVTLVGGYAMQYYGSDRLTADIDVVAAGPIGALKRGKALSFGGYSSHAAGVPVDVILRDDDFAQLYEAALSVSRLIVRLEYLPAMKMVAGRDKDHLDLMFLLTHPDIDLKLARLIVKRHLGAYAAKEFDSFVEEAKWKKGKQP